MGETTPRLLSLRSKEVRNCTIIAFSQSGLQ